MTGEELKAAFLAETPVTANGIEYVKISAIIYRKQEGRVAVQAELLDKNRNSITVTAAASVEAKE